MTRPDKLEDGVVDAPRDPAAVDDRAAAVLDRAVALLRDDAPPADVVAAVGARAWPGIAAAARDAAADAAGARRRPDLLDASDYPALIDDYLAGRLSPARALLVADHVREDAGFRAAVEAARAGSRPPARADEAVRVAPAAPAGPRRRRLWMLATAVGVASALGIGLAGPDAIWPNRVLAHVAAVDGALVEVTEREGGRPLGVGDALRPGRRVRATNGDGAVVELGDGSTLELGPRAEVALASGWRGPRIVVDRGDVVVRAAPQGRGRLGVSTADVDVAVKGTIFAVRHGAKGSRVSVVAGAVDVAGPAGRARLEPGMQYVSRDAVGRVPVAEDVAWSRDSEEYIGLLAALGTLGADIDAAVARPAPRTVSRLIDAVPADTAVFVGLPNLGAAAAEGYARFKAGVAADPTLGAWWSRSLGAEGPDAEARLDALVGALGAIGEGMGDELVVAVGRGSDGSVVPPLLLAEVPDAAAFESTLKRHLVEIAGAVEGGASPGRREDRVVVVTDRAALDAAVEAESAAAPSDAARLTVWLGGGKMAISPSAARVAAHVDGPRGLPGGFRTAVAETYASGVDAILGIDVGAVAGPEAESLVDSARYAVVTQVAADGGMRIEAAFTFDGESEDGPGGAHPSSDGATDSAQADSGGLNPAAWLAAPGPIGALDFVSPDAYVAGAALVASPEQVVADFLGLARAEDATLEWDSDVALGADVMADLAAALGGEVAFAVDGPLVPAPAWKMVVEVTDAAVLENAVTRAVEHVNARRAAEGRETNARRAAEGRETNARRVAEGRETPGAVGRRLVLSTAEMLGGTVWTLGVGGDEHDGGGDASDAVGAPIAHWLVVDGYLIAAPDAGILAAALRTRESGVSLARTDAFRRALPPGHETGYSAVLYQDLGRLGDVALAAADAAGEASAPESGLELDLASRAIPSAVVAWSEPGRLRLAAASNADPLGMSFLLPWLAGMAGDGPRLPEGPPLPMPRDGAAGPAPRS